MFNRQAGFDQLMCLFAAAYKSEAEAGEALAEAIKTGLVKREGGFFVTTKVYFIIIDVFLAHFLEKEKGSVVREHICNFLLANISFYVVLTTIAVFSSL